MLVDMYSKKVFNMAYQFSGSYHEAEDLTQDVYLKAFRNLSSLKNPGLSKEWLYRVAKNTCLDHQKKTRLRRLLLLDRRREPQEKRTPESMVTQSEQVENLKRAVRVLPKKLRVVFILREYGHFSYQDIAATLGIKDGTVMSRLSRARAKVVKAIKEATLETK